MADVAYLTPKIQMQWQGELKKINNTIIDVIADIEDEGNTSGFETRRANIQVRVLKLEIKMVKNTHFTPLLGQMQKLDQDLIPKSYAQVKASLVKLNDSISLNPRNMAVINNLVSVVESDLSRAKNVSMEVNWINSIEPEDHEDIALRYRNAFEKISLSIIEKDISSLSYNQQMVRFESEINDKLAGQTSVINGLTEKLAKAMLAANTVQEPVVVEANEDVITAPNTVQEPAVTEANEDDITTPNTDQATADLNASVVESVFS